jgi:hypothetical protein
MATLVTPETLNWTLWRGEIGQGFMGNETVCNTPVLLVARHLDTGIAPRTAYP